MDKSGYLYFYDEKSEYSQILHLSVLCASIVFKRFYLCVSERYYRFFRSRCLLPDNVEIFCITAESLRSPMLARLDTLYESGKLRSNCPPVERHCINRWLFLQENELFNEDSLFSIDWDTLVFPGFSAYQPHLRCVDLGATNLMTLGWKGAPSEPVWSLCPNLLYLSSPSLRCYIHFLNKYISYTEQHGSIVAGLFCDMQPWSSVIASSLVKKHDLKLLDFNDLAADLPLVDHNVRVTEDCGLQLKEMHYYFQQGTHTYINTPYLPAKHIIFSDDCRPYFVLKNSPNASQLLALRQPPQLKEAAAIHFSGVEGKHLLLQSFIADIRSYLNSNLNNMNIVAP